MLRLARPTGRPSGRRRDRCALRPRVDALESRALLSSFQLVKDVAPGTTGSGPYSLRTVGDSLLFTARPSPGVYSLFASDGTPAGTTAIKDGDVASGLRYPTYYAGVVGSRYFFVASDTSHGSELWVTDGTAAGTAFINDTEPGTGSGGGQLIAADPAHDAVYYVADDGTLPRSQVWRTDGTAAGTVKVSSIGDPQPPSGFGVLYGAGDGLTVASTGVYFLGSDSNVGTELYVTDGTAAGTRLVKDINPTAKARGAGSNGYLPWPELGGRLYFSANDAVSGWELWSTDGTEAGTRRETNINPAGDQDDSTGGPFTLVAYQGAIFFSAIDADHGRELWKFAPGVGASLVKDINPGAGSSMTIGEPYGTKLYESNGVLYFVANDGTHGDQLWRSDGTTDGTELVKAIATPANAFVPMRGLTTLGDTLYFAANEAASGWELWQSDGTEAGTHIVEDFVPGPGSGIALDTHNEWITVVGPALYFTANGTETGSEVYRYTPVASPFTFTVAPIDAEAGSAFDGPVARFTYAGSTSVEELQATIDWGDGTTATAGILAPYGSGGFVVSGSHTYALAGDYTVTVTVHGPQSSVGQVGTTAQVAAAPITLSGRLDPSSDSGVADSDGITRDTTPTFSGTGTPGRGVQIRANGNIVATTTVQPGGTWSVTVSTPLADGSYAITAAEPALESASVRIPGPPAPGVSLGTIVIDTVGPVVTGLGFQPRRALVTLTLLDERSGVALATLGERASYSVTRYLAPRPRDRQVEHVTQISATRSANPTQPATVSLRLDNGRPVTHARFRVIVRSGGITDLAGNALRGQFAGTFPSGNGGAAQDFQAQLVFDGCRVWPVRPIAVPVTPNAVVPRPRSRMSAR